MPVAASASRDPWQHLTRFTHARIAVGRAGGSLRTDSLLELRLAHARARDAVQAPFETSSLIHELQNHGISTELLTTPVSTRAEYLRRPDLGRRLTDVSARHLQAIARAQGRCDLAVIISDGLSARAAERHAVETLLPLLRGLARRRWKIAPVFVAPFGRVKLQDEIGQLVGARCTLMLLGERPGLQAPDSLGAYLTFSPHSTRTDADRNCVSNIRPEGLPPGDAAGRLLQLLVQAAKLECSGISLKIDSYTANDAVLQSA